MRTLENEKLYEVKIEQFFCAVGATEIYPSSLWDAIIDEEATHEEIWAAKEIGHGTEYNEAIDRFFDRIWEWDIDVACGDPIIAAKTFLNHLRGPKWTKELLEKS